MLIQAAAAMLAAGFVVAATAAEEPPPLPNPPGGGIWSQVDCAESSGGCDLGVGSGPSSKRDATKDMPRRSGGRPPAAGASAGPVVGAPVCTTTAEIAPEIRDNWIAEGRLKPGQRFVLRTCDPGGREWLVLDPAQNAAALVAPPPDPRVVAASARDRLALPTVAVRLSPVGQQLVGLPTWLWIDAAGWRPVSRSVTVPGATVTATAMPVSVRWTTGDGTTVVCSGPGTPYSPTVAPEAASPDCGHVYRSVSPDDGLAVSATVTWSVSWSGAGEAGVFSGLASTGTVRADVVDAPAVNVTPGGGR